MKKRPNPNGARGGGKLGPNLPFSKTLSLPPHHSEPTLVNQNSWNSCLTRLVRTVRTFLHMKPTAQEYWTLSDFIMHTFLFLHTPTYFKLAFSFGLVDSCRVSRPRHSRQTLFTGYGTLLPYTSPGPIIHPSCQIPIYALFYDSVSDSDSVFSSTWRRYLCSRSEI